MLCFVIDYVNMFICTCGAQDKSGMQILQNNAIIDMHGNANVKMLNVRRKLICIWRNIQNVIWKFIVLLE